MTTSNEKKPRKPSVMGPRGWLHRSLHLSGKQTAEGFLAEHRDFLQKGDLAGLTSPVLASFDAGDLLPTPALSLLQNLVMGYVLEQEVTAGERAMARAQENPGTSKPWKATIFSETGEIVSVIDETTGESKDLIQGFDFIQRAEGWIDRKLFNGAPGWYGIVESTTITVKGLPFSSRIERDAKLFSAMLSKGKHPFNKNTGSKSSRLSFGVHAKPSHASFSRG